MYGFAEKDFTINGIKSWIHCINISADASRRSPSYHYHNYIEFLYSISSDADVWINGERISFKTGDLAIINSGELHDVTLNNFSNYICVKFSPHILYANEQALLEFKYVTPFISENKHKKIYHKEELQNIDILSLTKEIIIEWDKKEPAYELVIRANILKIFTEILRIKSRNNALPEVTLTEPLKKAISYMHANFTGITEKEVADECGLSYNYFSYIFKESLGKSFNDYLLQIKLREAEKLLVLTDKSITEIAYELGFSTASHFISRFKDAKQITPNKFRKKLSSAENKG